MAKGFTLHLLSKLTADRKIALQKLAQESNAKVVFHGGVSDSEYTKLLQNSFALVSASKDEGFGIPLVEAMQEGTPVIVSNLEIFREVAGDAGTYFDSEEPADLANALSALDNKATWEVKSKQALAQSKNFDWDKSAEELLKSFSQLGN